MFGTEVIRLLREKWTSPTELAEELFAILSPNIPLTHDAPLTINNAGAGPALTINNQGASSNLIQFNNGGEPIGAITIDGNGVTFGGNSTSSSSSTAVGSSVFMGTVTGGSGSTYTVMLQTGRTVTVTVPGILGTEQVQPGSSFLVLKVAGGYVMPVPLWQA